MRHFMEDQARGSKEASMSETKSDWRGYRRRYSWHLFTVDDLAREINRPPSCPEEPQYFQAEVEPRGEEEPVWLRTAQIRDALARGLIIKCYQLLISVVNVEHALAKIAETTFPTLPPPLYALWFHRLPMIGWNWTTSSPGKNAPKFATIGGTCKFCVNSVTSGKSARATRQTFEPRAVQPPKLEGKQ
jgi:hypothetical protein